MRFHNRYPLLQLWLNSPDQLGAITAESLAIARYEPAVSNGVHGTALLDLIFGSSSDVAVVPHIEIDTIMLLERGRTPLIWPHAARLLGYELDRIERRILPWLVSLTLARQANEEVIRRYSNAIEDRALEAAQSARFLGASSYSECMAAFAPYAYATRFCNREATVGIADPHGASGAAMLASRGAQVRADLGDTAQNAFARSWFGRDIYGSLQTSPTVTIHAPDLDLAKGEIDIALDRYANDARAVQIATPVPGDVLISFDTEDAPPVRSFGISVAETRSLRSPISLTDTPISGGSAGTILMVLREGFDRADDADTDEASALATRLRAEGFTVDLAPAHAITPDRHADLVHVFGLHALEHATAALQRFRTAHVPIVATLSVSCNLQDAFLGPETSRAVFARSRDEGLLEERLELLALRRVSSDASTGPATAQAAELVDVAIVGTCQEEGELRQRLGFQGRTIVSASYLSGVQHAASPITSLAGTAPFAFVQAPLEWRTNPVMLMRAAAALEMPVVFAGPTIDVDALVHARALAPELLLHLPSPSEEEVSALYRTARVFIDVSWSARGTYRLQRALASGCAVVVSRNSYAAEAWPEAVTAADPASPVSIAEAIKSAWGRVPAATATAVPGAAFSAVISAYATAQQMRVPA